MKNLLKIGQVSKLYNISLDTLRYYDEKGYLQPIVDETNGYRYYSLDHLDVLEMILVARSLNIPLDEIKGTLKSEDIRSYLELMMKQQDTIIKQMSELKRLMSYTEETIKTLQSIERIRHVSSEVQLSDCDVTVVEFPITELIAMSSSVSYTDITTLQQWVQYTGDKSISNDTIGLSIHNEEAIDRETLAVYNKAISENILPSYQITYDFKMIEFWGTQSKLMSFLDKLIARYSIPHSTVYVTFPFSLTHEDQDHEYYSKIYFKQ